MANTIGIFTPYSAEFPTSNAVTGFPQLMATAGHTTNAMPRPVLAFDASTTETCMWTGLCPQGYVGNTVTVLVQAIMASAVTGAVCLATALEAITPGDAGGLLTTDYYGSVTTARANVSLITTAGLFSVSLPLADTDGMAAGDYYRLRLARHHADTSDTATGDLYALGVELRDG